LLDEYPDYQLIGHRTVCRKDHLALLPRAIWHREQPFSLGVEISRMVLSELTTQHVKVVLTGEGADEILGGYSWYRADKLLAPFSRLPPAVRQCAAQLLKSLTPWPGLSRILQAPTEMNGLRYGALIGQPTGADARELFFSEQLRQTPTPTGDAGDELPLPPAFHEWHPFAQLQYFDIKVRLAQSVCHHLDRLSMAYSLEARVPFLDHRFVEFCATIPPWVKLRRLQEKHVLRRALRDRLPQAIVRRRKFPLSAPVQDWLRGALPDFATELLSAEQLRAKGYFDPAAVASVMRRHHSGQGDHSRSLLLILGTQLWDERFLKQLQP
jgi:asparagine synthase (glutamine-hydrolysing)